MKDEPSSEKTLLETLNKIIPEKEFIIEFCIKVDEKGENSILSIIVFNLDLRDHAKVNSVIKSINEQFNDYKEFQLNKQIKNIKNNEQNTL